MLIALNPNISHIQSKIIFPLLSMISQAGAQLELIRLKIPCMEEKLKEPFPLCHELTPLNCEQFAIRKQQLMALLKVEFNSEELQKFNDILLGSIEGLSGHVSLKQHFKTQFGLDQDEVLDSYLKEKTQVKYYGQKKQKNRSIHEVKNLEHLGNTYDIKAIKNHRKFRNIYKNSIKSASKFIQTFTKLQKQGKINQQIKKLYDQFYRKAYDDEIKYIDMKKKIEETKIIQKQAPIIAEIIQNPEQNKPQLEQNIVVEQTVKKQSIDEKSDAKNIDTTAKKTKKAMKKKKKQLKESQKETQKNETEKQENQNQITPIPKKEKSQVTLDCFLKAPKQKSPQKPVVDQMTIKEEPGNQNSISMPFAINKITEDQREKAQDQLVLLLEATALGQTQNFPSIQQLKADFQSEIKNRIMNEQMMIEQRNICEHFCNLVLWDSRLEFQNHAFNTYAINFTSPFDFQTQIRYMDDSFEVYEDLVAQNLEDKQEVEMEEEQEEASSANNTIVPDGYFSEAEISSNQDAGQRKDMRFVKILDGKQQLWQFSYRKKTDNQEMITMIDSLEMIPIFDDERQMCLPLAVMQMEAEPGTGITIPLKMQLMKQIHGYFNSKQSLVKKLSGITDKLSQNALNNFIKQVSYKTGTQRLIKQEIIDQMKESKQDFENDLLVAKSIKDQQIQASQAQKNNQRDQKIQTTILQYDGPKHVFDLLKYLKDKSYRFTKKQLQQFLSSRVGEVWDGIKNQFTFKKSHVKEKQKQKKQQSAKSQNKNNSSEKSQNKNNSQERNDCERNSQMIDENEQKKESDEKSKPQVRSKPLPPAYKPLDFFFKKQQQKVEQIKSQGNEVVVRERMIDKIRREQQQKRKQNEQQLAAQAAQKARKQEEKRLRKQMLEKEELMKIKKGEINLAQKVQLSQHQMQEQRKDGRQRRAPRKKYIE